MNVTVHDYKEGYRLLIENSSEFVHDFFSKFYVYLLDTVEHLILAFILYVLTCILLYMAFIRWGVLIFNRDVKNSKRILFVIAHPDDECMFFGPTILHYTKKKDCIVYLMCLTTGRNYGMGKVRKNELHKSCKMLGIQECNIFIHSHTLLPDAMNVVWPTELVSQLLSNCIDSLSITTVITFDRYGVSSHNNHCSIYYGIANLVIDNKIPDGCDVYVLESTSVIRKYWLFLDLPLSIFSRFRYMGGFSDRKTVVQAMKQHKSQLLWFRRLYMIFSRYMLMNTLQQMSLVDIELDLELDD